ncbi:MAG: flagellar filament capping protein FliD, partial [Myxococcales bacterium]|nr:flagellar filament capping protein FliD [Myxococcales bacterium]
MTPIASFSGLATGIDTASLIESLVKLEQAPIRRLQTKQADLGSISRRLGTIKSRMTDFHDAAEKLAEANSILLSKASSSQESKVKVSAEGGASLGTYGIEITSLARAERTYGDAIAGKDAMGLFGSGTLSIQAGTAAAVEIAVDPAETLETLAAKINSSGAEVTAGIVFDGTSYRLQVTGNETGAAKGVTFTETGTTLGLDDPTNELVSAADAAFSVDGIAMTRSTNTVTDAVPGVTLDLLGTTAPSETVMIDVSRDAEGFADLMEEFTDAYNAVASAINAEFVYTGQARTGDSLSGDTMLRTLQSRLSREILDPTAGLSDTHNRLAALGVSMNQGGTLDVDRSVLMDALNTNAAGVSDL